MAIVISNKQKEYYPIPIIVTFKNDKLCLELRKSTTEIEQIKFIISSAFHEQPLIIVPTFSNKFRTIGNLLDKGILRREDNGELFYNL